MCLQFAPKFSTGEPGEQVKIGGKSTNVARPVSKIFKTKSSFHLK